MPTATKARRSRSQTMATPLLPRCLCGEMATMTLLGTVPVCESCHHDDTHFGIRPKRAKSGVRSQGSGARKSTKGAKS